MAKLHCAFTIILLCVTQSVKLTSGQGKYDLYINLISAQCIYTELHFKTLPHILSLAGTLGFYLNGVAYPNGSTVLRTDIGEGDAALQCTTDSITCCAFHSGGIRGGEFFFPVASGGGWVPNPTNAINGYYRNRGSQLIRLSRQPSGVITGQFRCNIPSASGDVDLFINISEFNNLLCDVNNNYYVHYLL